MLSKKQTFIHLRIRFTIDSDVSAEARMAQLEDLTRGKTVQGILSNRFVTVIDVTRDTSQIANEVIQHLGSLNAEVQVTLEIQVRAPDGIPNQVIRTISENCRVLRFSQQSFEEE